MTYRNLGDTANTAYRGKFHVIHMSNFIKLYTLNTPIFLYVNFTSIKLLKSTLSIQLFIVLLIYDFTFLHSQSTQ